VIDAYRQEGIRKGAPGELKDPLMSDSGRKQLFAGFEAVCAMPYTEATKLAEHPVACIDCHDPENLRLRVTRPGFMNGIQALAGSDDPVPHLPSVERWRQGPKTAPYDPNTDASRQEMRSMACAQCHVEYYLMACAQCHVEYYFKGDGKLVTFPWFYGLKVEDIEQYYDDQKFSDWKHPNTGAGVLKAQHPEFELWSQGIHARAGVSCADCHMPYKREGAIKISDHHVRSPLLNIARACQTCHNVPETELLARAETIQARTHALLDSGTAAVMDLIGAIEAAGKAGASDDQLTRPRSLQRAAQFRLDFISAENSVGFHADQESARILGEAIDLARQGQVETVKLMAGAAPPAGGGQ
jgi:nitrite reductase (cytochrome c-552)